MTTSPDPGQSPIPRTQRRGRRRRHPAARTRRGLAVGSAVATAMLTVAYWIGDLTTSTAATTSSGSSASSSDDSSSATSRVSRITSDDDLGLSVSPTAPHTSSHAS